MLNKLKSLFTKETPTTPTENTTPCISLEKKLEERKISLTKIVSGTSIENVKFNVVLAIDNSGSMMGEYYDGNIQTLLERLLPVALRLDNDGELICYQFDDGYSHLVNVTVNNINGYVKKHMTVGGFTNYYHVMSQIVKVAKKSDIPTYVIFITDGDTELPDSSYSFIRNASSLPIFWKFVGIGYEDFPFLESLDDMEGREVDNADAIFFDDINSCDDEELYKLLMQEVAEWYNNCKAKGIIK